MLNELESLSGNIGRLIQISERHSQARIALEAQIEQLRSDYAAVNTELAKMREERDTLQAERDSLSAKIDDAQVRLNAILEKLPRGKSSHHPDSQAEAENQLDLLDARSHDVQSTHEHAHAGEHSEHHHGEKA